MRATILPYAIILTKTQRATVRIMAMGCIVVRVLLLRFFLFLLPNFTNILVCFCYLHCLVTSLNYSFLNTPKQQYFMLLEGSNMYRFEF